MKRDKSNPTHPKTEPLSRKTSQNGHNLNLMFTYCFSSNQDMKKSQKVNPDSRFKNKRDTEHITGLSG